MVKSKPIIIKKIADRVFNFFFVISFSHNGIQTSQQSDVLCGRIEVVAVASRFAIIFIIHVFIYLVRGFTESSY